MYQQINLYQPVFRQQHKIFSAATLLKILAVVGLLLTAILVHSHWSLARLKHTSASLENQYRQLDNRLNGLVNATETASKASQSEDIVALQNTIALRHALLEVFDHLSIRTRPGFGDFFEMLARNSLPGVWLTGVSLQQTGETEIRGRALDPKLVPHYLQQLPPSPRIRALNTGSVHLARADPKQPEIEFTVRSRETEEGK